MEINLLKKLIVLILFYSGIMPVVQSQKLVHDFYQIRIYRMKSDNQVRLVDSYLEGALLPALHRIGIKPVGVFKPIANDTALVKSIYVLIPFKSPTQWNGLGKLLGEDKRYVTAAKDFIEAPHDQPPFERMESILLNAFPGQPHLVVPSVKNPDRVFELRSYESPTIHLAGKKMAMFNTGGEIRIFNRLKFNPVFYGEVVSGSRMPNLMYMPIFDNVADRNAQWKIFGNDPKWKEIAADPVNENNVSVSHIDSILMHSTSYSDY
jgi:NIPSNAP